MADITVHDLHDYLISRLRIRAARHGHSLEEEARSILCSALQAEPPSGRSLVDRIRAMVEPYGGIEVELPPRGAQRDSPEFH